jgi:DNA (cytosine-5)-methyltransferase 1
MPHFVDLFAGAGGLSLGLLQAGWNGLFAIEKSPMAFETLKFNLVDQEVISLDWPDWLPKAAIDIHTLLQEYDGRLRDLENLPLLAGGPPCQGFSISGRRRRDDERNVLIDSYLAVVERVRPQLLLIENVRGFTAPFIKTEKGSNGSHIQTPDRSPAEELESRLREEHHYKVFTKEAIMAREFGVPQLRPRYILIAIREDLVAAGYTIDPFDRLYQIRKGFLSSKKLPTDIDVTLEDAISDLERVHGELPCNENGMKRFSQGVYGPAKSPYQHLMRQRRNGNGRIIPDQQLADSHRFANHKSDIEERFKRIIAEFRPGIQLNEDERKQLGLNKHRIAPLAPNEACHTLTSLPDDLIHYREPRIPTVREYARIQSFPDWFEFKSKYTSGGKRRRTEVPRYTQVANAVPPLLAEAIGRVLLEIYSTCSPKQNSSQPQPEEILA